jgi:hypothetical protein
MCGIAGLFGPFVTGLVSPMNLAQKRRGPDEQGVFEDRGGFAGAINEQGDVILNPCLLPPPGCWNWSLKPSKNSLTRKNEISP